VTTHDLVYLDNAATSWPKPPEVAAAVAHCITEAGANPGRSGHRLSVSAGRIVETTRASLAEFFGLEDPFRVVFGPNVTYAINLVLRGFLRRGDRVITSCMEHNSVMRPLRALAAQGVELDLIPCSPRGELDPDDLRRALETPATLVVLTQASNVCGTMMPIEEAGRLARGQGVPLLVDGAAGAGVLPLDLSHAPIDLYAFTGHKGLLGPTGTGGLILGPDFDAARIAPILHGGTGSRSEAELQPEFLPDRFEAGTANAAGLAGLGAGVAWLREQGVDLLRRRQVAMLDRLITGLTDLPGVTLHGTGHAEGSAGALAFTLSGWTSDEAALRLDEVFGVLSRPGLHCAPRAHRSLGTFPRGTLRFAPGPFTTDRDLEHALKAVAQLAGEGGP
jgi:cysteine desulfurase / selenocysteine lyase